MSNCKDGVCNNPSAETEELVVVHEQGMFGDLEIKDPTVKPVNG